MFADNNKQDTITKLLCGSLNKINCDLDILYLKQFITLINNKFDFAFDQQDCYELFHRLIDLYNSNNINTPFTIEWETNYICSFCSNKIIKEEKSLDISCTPGLFNVNNY